MQKERDRELMSAEEVAAMKKRHRNSIEKALRDGSLYGVKVAGRWVIRRADAEAWQPPRRGPKSKER